MNETTNVNQSGADGDDGKMETDREFVERIAQENPVVLAVADFFHHINHTGVAEALAKINDLNVFVLAVALGMPPDCDHVPEILSSLSARAESMSDALKTGQVIETGSLLAEMSTVFFVGFAYCYLALMGHAEKMAPTATTGPGSVPHAEGAPAAAIDPLATPVPEGAQLAAPTLAALLPDEQASSLAAGSLTASDAEEEEQLTTTAAAALQQIEESVSLATDPLVPLPAEEMAPDTEQIPVKRNPTDFVEEVLSEMAVRELLGLPIDIGLETNMPIGKEYAGVFVVPWQTTTFNVEVDELSKAIVVFTWVKANRVQILGWLRREQLLSLPRGSNGETTLSIDQLQPIKSLKALAPLRSANQGPTDKLEQRRTIAAQGINREVGQVMSELESSRWSILSGASGSPESFPAVDAPAEVYRQFVDLACTAMPRAMLARLRRRDDALLWLTRYLDGTVTAEASDIFAYSAVADQLAEKPRPGEIAVVLAHADVPWSDSAMRAGKVGFWQGIISFKKPIIQ